MSKGQQPVEKGEEGDSDSSNESALALGSRAPALLRSESLLCGRREVLIRHGSEHYRLCLTRMNKLILTK